MIGRAAFLVAAAFAATPAAAAPAAKTIRLLGSADTPGNGVNDTSSDGAAAVKNVDRSLFMVRRFGGGGILADANLEVNLRGRADLDVRGYAATKNRASASGSARLSGPHLAGAGFDMRFSDSSVSASCEANRGASCSTSNAVLFSQQLATRITDLAPYYASGFGNVEVRETAQVSSDLVLDGLGSSGISRASAQVFTNYVYTPSVTYTYYDFSDPSFLNGLDSLTLDFGTLTPGDPLAILNFDLFNRGPAGSAGLDLDSLLFAGDTGFSTSLAPFRGGIEGGGSQGFTAGFLPTAAGSFSGTYTIRLSDQDLGIGMRDHTLTLNLLANVAAVPEPATWATMIVGFAAVGGAARRRRRIERAGASA